MNSSTKENRLADIVNNQVIFFFYFKIISSNGIFSPHQGFTKPLVTVGEMKS